MKKSRFGASKPPGFTIRLAQPLVPAIPLDSKRSPSPLKLPQRAADHFRLRLLAEFPNPLIHTSGRYVGLPTGQMGNSCLIRAGNLTDNPYQSELEFVPRGVFA
jgi:hypothetical protein